MNTIANELYQAVNADSSEGVTQQVISWCADNDSLIESIESGAVIFTDGSAVTYDDYSIAVAG